MTEKTDNRRQQESGLAKIFDGLAEFLVWGLSSTIITAIGVLAGIAYRTDTVKDVATGTSQLEQMDEGYKSVHLALADDLNGDGIKDAIALRADGYQNPLFGVEGNGDVNFYSGETYTRIVVGSKIGKGVEEKLNSGWTVPSEKTAGVYEEVHRDLRPYEPSSFVSAKDFDNDGVEDHILTRRDGYKVPMFRANVGGVDSFYPASEFAEISPVCGFDYLGLEERLNEGWKNPINISAENNNISVEIDDRWEEGN